MWPRGGDDGQISSAWKSGLRIGVSLGKMSVIALVVQEGRERVWSRAALMAVRPAGRARGTLRPWKRMVEVERGWRRCALRRTWRRERPMLLPMLSPAMMIEEGETAEW